MRWGKTYSYPLVVQFEDVDFLRVVHHPNYLKYCERARIQALESEGLAFADLLSSGFGLVIAEARMSYRMPLEFGHKACIQSRLAAVSSASFRVRQVIHDGSPSLISLFEETDVDDWHDVKGYHALGDFVNVHVATGESNEASRARESRIAPMSPRLLSVMGIASLAQTGQFDQETKSLLRSSRVRLS